MRLITALLSAAAVLFGANCFGQPATSAGDSPAATAAKVYIDCDTCDYDFVRTEITFVNFVRDRAEADIHIILSKLQNAAGGYEYTVEFRGQKTFTGLTDTLKTYSLETDSDDITRKKLVRIFKLGLTRFVARTPLGNDVNISYNRPAMKTEKIDKWKSWVFTIDANTWVEGEKSYRHLNFYADLNASRVSEKNRFMLEMYSNYYEDRYGYGDSRVLKLSRGRGAEVDWLFGLNEHWSIGAGTEWFMSSYSNYDNVWQLFPTIEYDIFPYKQATRRQLRLQYLAAVKYNDYGTTTIYDKNSEWLAIERLSVHLKFIQPWGSSEIWTSASHYFHDFSMNRVEVGCNVSLKLVKGLSLTMDGNYSAIHDQLNIVPEDVVTRDDLLLQRRQQATSYSYYGSVGLKYSFGSIYSNVVNPRFGY